MQLTMGIGHLTVPENQAVPRLDVGSKSNTDLLVFYSGGSVVATFIKSW